MESMNTTQMNISAKQKHSRYREQTCGSQVEVGGGKDWEFGISRCKLLYVGWITNKDLLYSTGNYIQCPVINQWKRMYKKKLKMA